MKRSVLLCLTLIMLAGCGKTDDEMAQALELRSRCLAADEVSFQVEITADYTETTEEFSLACSVDHEGGVSFCVEEPEEIAGICGRVSGTEGTLEFEDQILGFPLMADEQLSPLAGPWLMMKAIRFGAITACAKEGELLHITMDDSYSDNPMTVDVWAENEMIEAAEISWQGRRFLTIEIDAFRVE